MAITLGWDLEDGIYNVRILHRDGLNEEVKKSFRINNGDQNLSDALEYYDAISQAGIVDLGASLDAEPAGASATSTSLGQFSKVGDMLVLAFYRGHPLDATKIITNEFVIVAPDPDIYSSVSKKPTPDLVATFATATPTDVQKLGALINWLEDNLITENFGTITVGGWTYDPEASRLIGTPRVYDGNPRT